MRKVELLAPAGNYESFLGAVHAGADAVYLEARSLAQGHMRTILQRKRFAGQ